MKKNNTARGGRVALIVTVRDRTRLEREAGLHLEAAIVAIFGEGAEAAGERVGRSEERGRNDAVDRAGIYVIQQVACLD